MPEQTATPIPSQPNAPQACAAQQGTHVPVGAVTQIQERVEKRLKDALNQAERTFEMALQYGVGTSLGREAYAAAQTIQAQQARIEDLGLQLVEEAARTAKEKLRADQMTQQHAMQASMHSQVSAQLAAVQQGVQQIKANCYSNDDGDYWRDCPDDGDFVEGLKVGDTFELQASVRSWSETFRVTRAPDETSDDYEVELVSSDAPLATHPTQQGRDLAAVIKSAADKLDAAKRCHANAVETLIDEALEILDGDRDPTQQGLDAPVLDDAWKARLLDGRELERDEIGCAFHPALPNIDEGVRIDELLKVFGIEWNYGTAESEMSDEAYEEMVFGDQDVDYRKWTPKMPDGDDWKLVAIFDTDDGPVCWWVRAAQAKQGEQA